MSNIGLLNVYSPNNLGDAAIYAALARLSEPHTVCTDRDDLAVRGGWTVQHAANTGRCDAFVSVGGDIFNNARPRLVTRRFLANLNQLRRAPERTLLFGQSIPQSCRGAAFAGLIAVLRKLSSVYVRDAESWARLRKAGLDCALSHDTAFALAPNATHVWAARNEFEALDIDPDKAALISVRGFDALYRQDSRRFEQSVARLCRLLANRGHQPVLLVQSQVDEFDGDRGIVERVRVADPRIRVFDAIRPAAAPGGWGTLIGALAQARIVVGVRYHTAVLRLASERMPFNLYYSNKGADLGRSLNVPGVALAAFDPDEHLRVIEATADMGFRAGTVRRRVRKDFMTGLGAALGSASQPGTFGAV